MENQLSFLPNVIERKKERYNSLYTELIKESLEAMQQAHKFFVLKEFNAFLMSTLPQKSPLTRNINANKIIDRFIQNKNMNSPLIKLFREINDLNILYELLYFHFLNREKIVKDFVKKVLFENLDVKCLNKKIVEAFCYLSLKREDKDTVRRLIRTLIKFKLIKKEKNNIIFANYKPDFKTFLYVLHYEFNKPDSYLYEKLVTSDLRKIYLISDKDLQDLITEGWNKKYIGYTAKRENWIIIKYNLEEIVEKILQEI